MIRLAKKIVIFLLLNLLLLLALLYFLNWQVERQEFKNWNTEANLLFMPKNTHFDIVMLGTSHTRMFSRAENHLRMEDILDKKILNLSQGYGRGGMLNQYAFLRYFYWQNNSADTLVYFLDPFVFFNKYFDSKDKIFEIEPFRPAFLYIITDLGFEPSVIYSYLYSKFTKDWLSIKPIHWKSINNEIERVNAVSVFRRYNVVYPDDIDMITYREKKELIRELVEYIKYEKGTPLVFAVPPSLIEWPGHNELIEVLKQVRAEYGIPFYDYARDIREKKFYKDHDHLNTKGVEYFTSEYLKKVFSKEVRENDRLR